MAYFPPTGSVVAFQSDPTKLVGTVSVVGTVSLNPTSVAALQSTNPWQMTGSVAVMSAVPYSVATLQGTNPWIVSNTSVAVMSAVPHSVATLQGTNPWVIGNTSVLLLPGLNVIGSVATLQGTNPWLVLVPGSVATASSPASVSGVGLFNVNHTGSGSIITVFSSPSIVGTYAEDSGHVTADKGVFTLGVRNDTISSFVSADLDYTPRALDSAGRTLTKPFAPDHASVFGTGSVNGAASVIVIAAPGTGLRNYITDIMIANTGSVSTLITFTAGGGSVLGKTIAPAGGGSNIIGMATPIAVHVNSPFNVDSGTASSVVHATAYGYKAQ